MQSDRLEGEFGAIRQMSDGCYLISVDQVISSLSLRRSKLYNKLGLENVVDTNKNIFFSLCTFSQVRNIPERIILISTTGLR